MLRVGMRYDRSGSVGIGFHYLLGVRTGFKISHGDSMCGVVVEVPYFTFHGSERRVFGTFGEVFPGTSVSSRRAGDMENYLSGEAALRETSALIVTDEVLRLGDTAGLKLGTDGVFFTGVVSSTSYDKGEDLRTYDVRSLADGDDVVTWPVTDAYSFSESLNPDDYYNQVTIDKDLTTLVEELPPSYSYKIDGTFKSRTVSGGSVVEECRDSESLVSETYTYSSMYDPDYGSSLMFLTGYEKTVQMLIEDPHKVPGSPESWYPDRWVTVQRVIKKYTLSTAGGTSAPFVVQEDAYEWEKMEVEGCFGGAFLESRDSEQSKKDLWLQFKKWTTTQYGVQTFPGVALVVKKIRGYELKQIDEPNNPHLYNLKRNGNRSSTRIFPISIRNSATLPPWGYDFSPISTIEYSEVVDGEITRTSSSTDRKRLHDMLPLAQRLQTIREVKDTKVFEFKDEQSIEKIGLKERRVQRPDTMTIDAEIEAYGRSLLRYYAEAVKGSMAIPLNPAMQSGDYVSYDGNTWRVETATHDLGEWSTSLTLLRAPTGVELAATSGTRGQTAEDALVQVIRDATGRVDNISEMVIIRRISRSWYIARDVRTGVEKEISLDYVLYGDLPGGARVMVGRGSF